MNVTDFDNIKPMIISVLIIFNITLNVIEIAVIVKYTHLLDDRSTFSCSRFLISPTDVQ